MLDDGARVRVQPGATVRQVNARLARYGRKLGPDPASEAACTIGGVVANNSVGMACGTVENSYRTLESLVLVLPSGTVVDTGAADADERLRALEPGAARRAARAAAPGARRPGVGGDRQPAVRDEEHHGLRPQRPRRLRHRAEILAHLMVGSEGTLAFVAEATFRTVPVRPHAASALLVFDDLAAAQPRAAGARGHRCRDAGADGRHLAAGRPGASPGPRPPIRRSRSTATPRCWSSTRRPRAEELEP